MLQLYVIIWEDGNLLLHARLTMLRTINIWLSISQCVFLSKKKGAVLATLSTRNSWTRLTFTHGQQDIPGNPGVNAINNAVPTLMRELNGISEIARHPMMAKVVIILFAPCLLKLNRGKVTTETRMRM
jgi:hypothetical protein